MQELVAPSLIWAREAAELREQILDEFNNRLRQNLKILYGFLQAADNRTNSSEAHGVLRQITRRIVAMGTAQQIFYSAGIAVEVSAETFLRAVCDNARVFLNKGMSITCEPTDGFLPKETLIPLALVLNELLTNAAEHGSDDYGRVAVSVGLNQAWGRCELYVQDDGPGFTFERPKDELSGLGLVMMLTERLRGTFSVERTGGARCTLEFADQ